MTAFLFDGPQDGPVLLLTHGSGAPMDTPFMTHFAQEAAKNGVGVARFEFEFMAQRRTTGKKRPPPKAEKLMPEFLGALDQLRQQRPGSIFIGGKSLGARVATMIGQETFSARKIKGVVCLGYPFHPPGKPDALRTAHFENYRCPSLICQGENDPFGKRVEIETYSLPDTIQFCWAPFGNHDLRPPKKSGLTAENNIEKAALAVAGFISQS